ncbi:hypothetical protein E2C01_043567 [Portunus trituberculatus]|uniref:Uncharacterized protein n=1 Tax=Portunus trituberculatus TaxID=210409 RepID=A0A5B7FWQ4_PORTR|nr:hypothetical protein [Portunus trituberculatus]
MSKKRSGPCLHVRKKTLVERSAMVAWPSERDSCGRSLALMWFLSNMQMAVATLSAVTSDFRGGVVQAWQKETYVA